MQPVQEKQESILRDSPTSECEQLPARRVPLMPARQDRAEMRICLLREVPYLRQDRQAEHVRVSAAQMK